MLNQPPEQPTRPGDATTVKDALEFLSRRTWLCIGVAVPIILAAIILAFRWPPVYLSKATILIEQPAVPEDLIASTIRSYVDEQIQIVAQRVYTNESIMSMVEEFNLYTEERKTEGAPAIVERFLAETYLENLTAEITDDRGRAASTTFAFIVGFHHNRPEMSQKLAMKLADRFLEENLASRTERAATTTTFLEQEAERLAKDLADMETKLAKFKDQYAEALPEQMNVNMETLSRTETELSEVDQQLRELRADDQIIRSELASLDPHAVVYSGSGEPIFSTEQHLAQLRATYLQLSSRYGPQHPDVVRTRREIESIVGSGNLEGALGDVEQQRATLQAERAALLERYSPEHPDVVRVQKALDALPEPGSAAAMASTQRAPTNPTYLSAQARLESVQAGLAAAQLRRQELVARRARLEGNISMAPSVEQEWLQLNRGYNSARMEYEEIKRRSTGARLAENLEVQNKGERFTLLKRADLPTVPVEPNRYAIIILGVVLGIGAGVGLAALVDALDSTIRGPQDLQSGFALKPLGAIPFVYTAHDRRIAFTRRVAATGAAIACLVLVVALI